MAKKALALVPTGGRRTRALTAEVSQAIAAAANQIEKDLGGRAAIVAALAVTDLTPEISLIVGFLGDPQYDTTPLADLCQQAGIAPAEVLAAYKAAVVGRAQLLSLATVAAEGPKVVAALTKRAQDHTVPCLECRGTGKTKRLRKDPKTKVEQEVDEICVPCSGLGTVLRHADPAAQDRVLDLLGLLPKGSGSSLAIGVNIQQGSTGSAFGGGSLEQLQDAVSTILTTARTTRANQPAAASAVSVVDADVVPSP